VGDLRLPHFDGQKHFDIYQNYVIRTRRRDALRAYLTKHGVETLVHWPKPMWAHKGLKLPNPALPETAAICKEVISLPMSAETTPGQVKTAVATIKDFF